MAEEVDEPKAPWPLTGLEGIELGIPFNEDVASRFDLAPDLSIADAARDEDLEYWANDSISVDLHEGRVCGITQRDIAHINGVDLIGLGIDEVKAAIGEPTKCEPPGDIRHFDYVNGDFELSIMFWDGFVSCVSLYDYGWTEEDDSTQEQHE